MRKRLLVLGARAYAPVFADAFESCDGHEIVGFVENLDRAFCAERILDRPVHWVDDIEPLAASHGAICCLATTRRDGFVATVERMGFRFATLVHPRATVSTRATIAEGVSLDAGVVVAAFTRIGLHVRVGRGATIGHHVTVEPFVTIHPGANIAGNCIVHERTTVCIGATIIDGRTLGAGCVVAAGATVIDDVPASALVAGTPARVIRVDGGPL